MKFIEVTDPFGCIMHINAAMVVSVQDVTNGYAHAFPKGTPRITEIKLNTANQFSHTFVVDTVSAVLEKLSG